MEPLRILVVLTPEDERLASLATTLRHAGHEVQVLTPTEAEALLAAEPEAFDAVLRSSGPAQVAPAPLDEAEKHHIAMALKHTRGNKRQAAHLLGIARSTLLAKVRKYEL